MNAPRRLALRGLTAALLAGMFTAAAAQGGPAWPARTVRIVHGFTSGGPVDAIARMIAAEFGERFGQQAIVEGKPGAGGTVGAGIVAKAEPDGYTLFLMASGHSASPGLYRSLPYDPVGDFTMISMIARSPFAILAGPNAGITSIQDMMQKAKAAPGKIDYGSGGVGSGMHLVAVLLQARGGVTLNHVPYKGGGAPALALMSGEVPVLFTSLAGITSQIESGKMKPLAVTSRARFPGLPNVPTVAETVLPDFDVSAWYALAAPKGLPPALTARLNEVVQSALKKPEFAERLRAQSADVWITTPREAQEFLATDVARWTRVIRDEKIPPQN
jgi:tripartite-type tricarboxylate transporter receptor subunit TctC